MRNRKRKRAQGDSREEDPKRRKLDKNTAHTLPYGQKDFQSAIKMVLPKQENFPLAVRRVLPEGSIFQLEGRIMQLMEKKQFQDACGVIKQTLGKLQTYANTARFSSIEIQRKRTNLARAGLRCIAKIYPLSDEDINNFEEFYEHLKHRGTLVVTKADCENLGVIIGRYIDRRFMQPIYAFQKAYFHKEEEIKKSLESAKKIIKNCKKALFIVEPYVKSDFGPRQSDIEKQLANVLNDVYWTLGVVQENMGEKKEALTYYKKNIAVLRYRLPPNKQIIYRNIFS